MGISHRLCQIAVLQRGSRGREAVMIGACLRCVGIRDGVCTDGPVVRIARSLAGDIIPLRTVAHNPASCEIEVGGCAAKEGLGGCVAGCVIPRFTWRPRPDGSISELSDQLGPVFGTLRELTCSSRKVRSCHRLWHLKA